MEVFILTSADVEMTTGNGAWDNAQEALWSGHPYRSLEAAKQAIYNEMVEQESEFAAEMEAEPEIIVPLKWEMHEGNEDTPPHWEANRDGVDYLIRMYEV